MDAIQAIKIAIPVLQSEIDRLMKEMEKSKEIITKAEKEIETHGENLLDRACIRGNNNRIQDSILKICEIEYAVDKLEEMKSEINQ